MGKRPEPRKQIRVVSSKKRKEKTNRQFQEAPSGQIPLPRRGTIIKFSLISHAKN